MPIDELKFICKAKRPQIDNAQPIIPADAERRGQIRELGPEYEQHCFAPATSLL